MVLADGKEDPVPMSCRDNKGQRHSTVAVVRSATHLGDGTLRPLVACMVAMVLVAACAGPAATDRMRESGDGVVTLEILDSSPDAPVAPDGLEDVSALDKGEALGEPCPTHGARKCGDKSACCDFTCVAGHWQVLDCKPVHFSCGMVDDHYECVPDCISSLYPGPTCDGNHLLTCGNFGTAAKVTNCASQGRQCRGEAGHAACIQDVGPQDAAIQADATDAGAAEADVSAGAGNADASAAPDADASAAPDADVLLAPACTTTDACPNPGVCGKATCSGGACGTLPVADGQLCGGDGVCAAASCKAGVCAPAKSALWHIDELLIFASFSVTPKGAATMADGGVAVAVGFALGGAVVRVDPTGNVQWHAFPFAPSGNYNPSVDDVAIRPDGTIVAVGTDPDLDFDHAAVAWLSSSGSTLFKATYPASYDDTLTSVVALADGGVLCGGTSGNMLDSRLLRLTQDGKVVFSVNAAQVNSAGGFSYEALSAVGLLADGTAFAAGGGWAGPNTVAGAIWMVSPDGTAQSVAKVAVAKYLADAISTGTGILAVGEAADKSAGGLLVALDGKGNVVWHRTYPAWPSMRSLRPFSTGGILVSSLEATARVDAAGTPAWSGPGADLSLPLTGDASILVHFGTWGGSAGKAALRRIDAFGNATCGQSGSCVVKPFAACSDANPCTTDVCSLGVCDHVQLADATTCGTAKACVAGSCVAGDP